MISKEFFDAIQGAMERAVSLEDDPQQERLLKRAAAALDRAYHQAQERAVAADPDPTYVQVKANIDLIEDTIRQHAEIMLKHMAVEHIPRPGDTWPTYHQAMAAWHLARITALRTAPIDMAAQRIREDALAALTPTTKEKHG